MLFFDSSMVGSLMKPGRPGEAVIHCPVGGEDAVEVYLLDLGPEFVLHIRGIFLNRARCQVEYLGLSEVVDCAERADSDSQLFVVSCEHTLHLCSELFLIQGAESCPLVPGVGYGKDHSRLADAENLIEDRPYPNV